MFTHDGLSGRQRSTLPDPLAAWTSGQSWHTLWEGSVGKDGKHIWSQSLGWRKGPCNDWTNNHQVGFKWGLNCVGQILSSVVIHDWISASKLCHCNTNQECFTKTSSILKQFHFNEFIVQVYTLFPHMLLLLWWQARPSSDHQRPL